MSYLVTGGTGFIGAHIVRLLVQQEEKVVAYDAVPDRNLLERLIGKGKSNLVKVVQGNITDLAHLIRTCQEYGIQKIIHTAALLGFASSANPLSALQINCEGTVNWLYVEDAARVMIIAGKVATTKTRAFTVHGDVRSFAEVAAYVKSLIPGADITLLPGRTGFASKFDTAQAREELGYQPQWTIEKGVKKVIDYIRRQIQTM